MKINNTFRLFCAAFLITLIIFLLSPWISLLLPGRLKDHVYAVITYQVIADKETERVTSREEQTIKLFDYVRQNIFIPRGAIPYKGKPLDYLINGIGWCDYMSKVLDCLLAKKGIPARYAMLLDKEGAVSDHTLNEIFLQDKWAVFDPLTGIVFKDENGRYLTLEELSENPVLRLKIPRLIALRKLIGNPCVYYCDKFPLKHSPRRSDITIDDLNIFDHLERLYTRLLKVGFSNPFQDIYLKIKSIHFKDDYRLYYLARNYHLHYRSRLAKRYYNQLINNHPNSSYIQDSIFFLGVLYIKETHNYEAGINTLEYLLLKYPDTSWLSFAHLFLGLAYDNIGDTKEADVNYLNADKFKLDTDIINRILKYKS